MNKYERIASLHNEYKESLQCFNFKKNVQNRVIIFR